jgi:hypothetical protein
MIDLSARGKSRRLTFHNIRFATARHLRQCKRMIEALKVPSGTHPHV